MTTIADIAAFLDAEAVLEFPGPCLPDTVISRPGGNGSTGMDNVIFAGMSVRDPVEMLRSAQAGVAIVDRHLMAKSLHAKSGLALPDIDLFEFHQANQHMLEHLRKRLGAPAEKFVISMQKCGNTVSSIIPIALKMALDAGELRPGMKVMLLGFGVGYSWGGTIMELPVEGSDHTHGSR